MIHSNPNHSDADRSTKNEIRYKQVVDKLDQLNNTSSNDKDYSDMVSLSLKDRLLINGIVLLAIVFVITLVKIYIS